MSLMTTHVSAEAMLCRYFCLKFGLSFESEAYIDSKKVIHVLPAIWEVVIKDNRYSCYVMSSPQVFYFRKNHHDFWGMGIPAPEEFQYFSSTAKDYVGHNYPKSILLFSV